MTHRAAAELDTPSTMGFRQQTPLKPPFKHGCPKSGESPTETTLEFRIHSWRLLAASVVLSVALVVLTVSLEYGFVLATVAPGESLSWSLLRSKTISDQIDELNSYSGNAASALGALWTFALQLIVYVLVLAIVPGLMIDNPTMWARLVLLSIIGGVTWLAVQGFVATNVQLKPLETIPVLSFADLNGFNRDLMVNFQNYTPLVGDVIANPQASTATLLRTAITGTYPRETVACSVFPEGDHSVSVSFGFSSNDWLRYAMPNGSSKTTSAIFDMNNASSEDTEVALPMSQMNATSLAIFALEMTDAFFGVDTTVNTTRYEALWEKFGSEGTEDPNGFVGAFRTLMAATLSDEINYFQHFSTNESTSEFTQTFLSDQLTFDAVTFEIPLKRAFFSRTLTPALNTSSDGTSSTLTYTSSPIEVADDEDAVYEMAVWEDCTPNGCMLSGGLPEVNAARTTVYPDSQVLAVRICLDADGNEDPLETLEGCQYGHSLNSFLVFSVASRIEGDSMNIDSVEVSTTRRVQSDDSESDSFPATTSSTDDDSSTAMAASSNAASLTEDDSSTALTASGTAVGSTEYDSSTAMAASGTAQGSESNSFETDGPSPSTVDSSSADNSAPMESDLIPDEEIPGGDPTTPTPSQVLSSVSIRLDTRTPTPTTKNPTTATPRINVPTTKTPATHKPKPKNQATKGFSFLAKAARSSSDSSSSASSSTNAASQSTNYTLSAAASSDLASALTRKAYLKNARKIYTVTVGRVSWRLEDLAERFGARCNVTFNRDCQGLTFELANSSQRLVVGQQYLPLANLREYSGSSYLWTPLAKIKRDSGFSGDFAFKKAFIESNWPEDLNGSACKSSREEYIVSSLDNHLYSQHSFQPAYTASVMWLLQYGTANDIIDLDHNRRSLAFAANIIRSGVIMSTPANSSFFTYGACVLVIAFTLMVSFMTRRQHGQPLTRMVSTRAVAEVLLKENEYPPLFVKCYVHTPVRNEPATDVDPSITVVGDTTMEPLHSYSLQGLELQRNANSQWLSDRPNESV